MTRAGMDSPELTLLGWILRVGLVQFHQPEPLAGSWVFLSKVLFHIPPPTLPPPKPLHWQNPGGQTHPCLPVHVATLQIANLKACLPVKQCPPWKSLPHTEPRLARGEVEGITF